MYFQILKIIQVFIQGFNIRINIQRAYQIMECRVSNCQKVQLDGSLVKLSVFKSGQLTNQIVNSQLIYLTSGYFVLDMPQFPDIDKKHFHRLFSLTKIKSETHCFNIIVICNQLSNQYELPLAPKIILKPLNMAQYREILLNDLKVNASPDTLVQQDHFLQIVQEAYTRDIVSTFTIHTYNITLLLKISRELYGLYVSPVFQQYKSQKALSFMSRSDYNEAKKLLLDNPYQQINSKEFRLLVEENYNSKRKNESNKAQERQAIQALGTENQKLKLERIPSIILLASYYAAKNPEKTDKYIFKDYKKKKKPRNKQQQKVEDFGKKRCNFYRLMAISQVILSVIDGNELKQEQEAFNQSTQYFQQLQYLINQNYIEKLSGKDDDLSKVKYESKITEKQAYEIALSLDIAFYQYLYNPLQHQF